MTRTFSIAAILIALSFGASAASPSVKSIMVDTTGKIVAPTNFWTAITNDQNFLDAIAGVALPSEATNIVWPIPGANATASTNGLGVTINPKVGYAELNSTSNSLRSTITSTFLGGATSFNTRTGPITLLSSDVVSALGFAPTNSGITNGFATTASVNSSAATLIQRITDATNTLASDSAGRFVKKAGDEMAGPLTNYIGFYGDGRGLTNVTGTSANAITNTQNNVTLGNVLLVDGSVRNSYWELDQYLNLRSGGLVGFSPTSDPSELPDITMWRTGPGMLTLGSWADGQDWGNNRGSLTLSNLIAKGTLDVSGDMNIGTLSVTNFYGKYDALTNSSGHHIASTNYVVTYVEAATNGLGAGGISATTATNIAAYQAQIATNQLAIATTNRITSAKSDLTNYVDSVVTGIGAVSSTDPVFQGTVTVNADDPSSATGWVDIEIGKLTADAGVLVKSNSWMSAAETLSPGDNLYGSSNGIPTVIWVDAGGTRRTNHLVTP